MTYNFDPDRWLELRLALIDERHRRGEVDDDGWRRARTELEQRYEAMVERLDGTYRIPERSDSSGSDGDGSS